MHYLDANETAEEETRRQLHKNVESNIEKVLATTPHKTPVIRPLASHHENYTSKTNQTRSILNTNNVLIVVFFECSYQILISYALVYCFK